MHPPAHHEPGQPGQLKKTGYILFETCVAYIVAIYTVVSLISVFSLATKATPAADHAFIAAALAHELMAEVKLRKWDETQPASRPGYPAYSQSAIAVDSGESTSNKSTFDDIDDFNGWTEAPPQDPVGAALNTWDDMQRTVTVGYVTAALAPSGSPTDYKKVTVCALKTGMTNICVDWVASRL